MGQVFQKPDKTTEYVLDRDIDAAISEGWVPLHGQQVEFEGGGKTYQTPEEQIGTELGHPEVSTQAVNPLEELYSAQAEAERRKYDTFGQNALAGIEGAASTLSFGLSDAALSQLETDTAKRAEYARTGRVTGELAGILGAALLPGGQSKLAKVLEYTPAGAVSRGVAARTAGAGLGATAAWTAGEGALYGAGQAISNAALSDKPFTAEAFLADVGYNSLLGAGFGGVGGSIGYGLNKAARALERRQFLATIADKADEVADHTSQAVKRLDDLAEEVQFARTEPIRPKNFVQPSGKPVGAHVQRVLSDEEGAIVQDLLSVKNAERAKLGQDLIAERGPAYRQLVDEALGPAATEAKLATQAIAETPKVNLSELRTKAADAFGGKLDMPSIKAVLQSDRDVLPKLRALNDYYKGIRQAASANPELAAKADDIINSLRIPETASVANGLTAADLAWAIGAQEMPDFDGPVDDLFRWYALLRLGKPFAGKLDKHPLGKAINKFILGGIAHNEVAKFVGGKPYAVRAAAHGAVNKGGQMLSDLVFGHTQALAKSTGGVLSRIALVVDKLAKGVKSVSGKIAPVANLNFADEDLPKREPDRTKAQLRQIGQAMANPVGWQERIHEQMHELWATQPEVADEIEAKTDKLPQFLHRVMPKDPGTAFRLGASIWQPSDVEMAKWDEYLKGAFFPLDVLDDVVSGRVSAQSALAMREMNPAIFAKFQGMLIERAEEIRENLSYDQLVALSTLYDTPLDSTVSPKYSKFMQSMWTNEAQIAQQSQGQPGTPPSSPEPMTKAQQLLE